MKSWNETETCLIDIMLILCNQIQVFMNYANNYDSIINTINKLLISNSKFYQFLKNIDKSKLTNRMKYLKLKVNY
jgi:hypothetical protein